MPMNLRSPFSRQGPVIPVVRLAGAIGVSMPLRSSLSLQGIEPQLERAFGTKGSPAVALLINSPGGSAVQSHLIHRRIRSLAAEKRKKVIVAVEDVAASGGYLIALAGDEIVVDRSSIVGSIGVVTAMFGFPKLIEKLGVERRVHAIGENKDMLDPFKPERPADIERLTALQREIYGDFVDLVKARRGAALKDDPDLFTGAFWSGGKAVALGLVDRVGDLREVLQQRYGENVILRPIASDKGFLRRRLGLGRRESALPALAEQTLALIEERLLWSRFGL